jgi:hypothetical protein
MKKESVFFAKRFFKMLEQKDRMLFFETPKDKWKVFQKPRLVMFSEGVEVECWENTQPLYFYPFSWLDYLGKKCVRELLIQDCLSEFAEKEMGLLDKGKVHFEKPDTYLMRVAKEKGHKISVICNLDDLTREQIRSLSDSDFVRIRIGKDYSKLSLLSDIPNEKLLFGIKTYIGEGCDYQNLAEQSKKMGFDFIHVAKRLACSSKNIIISNDEIKKIKELKEIETRTFKVVIPSSLDEVFARRFVITPKMGNTFNCDFSMYRIVLKGKGIYPCYTQNILSQEGVRKRELITAVKDCSDCACIYENDMLFNIKTKMEKFKRPYFALEYQDD